MDHGPGATTDRVVVAARGRRVWLLVLADPDEIASAVHWCDRGETITQIVAKTGIPRTNPYRYLRLRPRPPEPISADSRQTGR